MPIGTSDGQQFENAYDMAFSPQQLTSPVQSFSGNPADNKKRFDEAFQVTSDAIKSGIFDPTGRNYDPDLVLPDKQVAQKYDGPQSTGRDMFQYVSNIPINKKAFADMLASTPEGNNIEDRRNENIIDPKTGTVNLARGKYFDEVGGGDLPVADGSIYRTGDPTLGAFSRGLTASPNAVQQIAHNVKNNLSDIADFLMLPGKAYKEGITPEEEIKWSTGMALTTAGANLGRAASVVKHVDEPLTNFRAVPAKAPEAEAISPATTGANSEKLRIRNSSISSPNSDLYHFETPDGKRTGFLDVTNNSDTLYVNSIGASEPGSPYSEAWSLGHGATRDLLEFVKRQYPDVKYIEGFRVSGARNVAGKIADVKIRIRK